MPNASTHARQPGRVASGFTLIEAMIATVIIGVAVTSLLAVIASGTRASGEALLMTRGIFIAQQMRERLILLPYRDPPISSPPLSEELPLPQGMHAPH